MSLLLNKLDILKMPHKIALEDSLTNKCFNNILPKIRLLYQIFLRFAYLVVPICRTVQNI